MDLRWGARCWERSPSVFCVTLLVLLGHRKGRDGKEGCAVRVGYEVWVPPNATSADIDAALEMMTPEERERTAKRFVRDLKWMVWRMKHPRLAAWIDAACYCGLASLGYRF